MGSQKVKAFSFSLAFDRLWDTSFTVN